ncbi:3'-5' exoribonuclease YhaM family protein [Thermoflavimicrobium dichotomicum]|uniref:3'-5' exoribonuclease n=1 Tax=Thermoflavimicrobium dichotomicum TaxID=46223 RepID=A0A1I3ULY6_9BACL|nr:HD domain-containing protein [Thermoflavimicrobium dichotomicum]SFJ82831.1 3'-5' exoribonuclease [Thermoflavimicrobium dichotomicum]
MLKVGDHVNHCFLVVDCQELKTKYGKLYLSLNVKNRLLECGVKIWDWESIKSTLSKHPTTGCFVKITGTVESYQGMIQIKTEQIEVIEEGEVDPSEIYATPGIALEEMENRLKQYLGMIKNPVLKDLCQAVITNKELYQLLITRPAAIRNHHETYHGLLSHIVSMMGAAVALQAHYHFLSLDLLLAGALFHDLGKVVEINDIKEGGYSTKGRLLGHMDIGTALIDRFAEKTGHKGKEEVDLLKHLVLSHHGKLEWGSPIEPRIPEAMALHMIDYMDAQFYNIFKQLKETPPGEWTSNRSQSLFKHSLSPVDQLDHYHK